MLSEARSTSLVTFVQKITKSNGNVNKGASKTSDFRSPVELKMSILFSGTGWFLSTWSNQDLQAHILCSVWAPSKKYVFPLEVTFWDRPGHWQSFKLRAQSFTSLKADLCQDINGGFAFSRCLNEKFSWRKCSVKGLVS